MPIVRVLVSTVLVFWLTFGGSAICTSSNEAIALSLDRRIEQFPQWQGKPSVQTAKGDLAYPEWMEGTWQVTSTLVERVAPLAPDLVTPGFEASQKDLNRPLQFTVRFSQDYFTNRSRFFWMKSTPIVADRAFNGKQIAQAYLGKDSVLAVKVDPDNPNKQITQLKGDRRLLAQVTGRAKETPQPHKFIATEITQQLFRSNERIYLNEVETTSAYELLSSGNVEAEQITAIYLSPQDPDYFTAAGHPVALYRYHLDLEKINLN